MCGKFLGFNSFNICCSIKCTMDLYEGEEPINEIERRKNFKSSYESVMSRKMLGRVKNKV